MNESLRNFFVGIFVIGALVTLGVLMVWFGETPTWLQRGEWTLRISGHEIRGIGDGSPVYLSGVEIGRVKRLEFENLDRPDLGVFIIVSIKQKYSVPAGSHAKVYGATLGIGRGQINIISPAERREPLPKDGLALLFGEMASPFGEIIPDQMITSFRETVVHVGDFAEASRPVAENLAKLLEQRPISSVDRPGAAEEGVTANFATAVERLDRLIASINQILGDEAFRQDLKSAAANLRTSSENLAGTTEIWKTESRRLSDNLNDGIDRTEQNLETLLVRLTGLAEELDAAAKHLNATTRRVAEGQGTVGLLVHDPRLYESAVLAAERLADFFAALNRIAGNVERDGYIPLEVKTGVGPIRRNVAVGDMVGQP